ncbi:MAG: iron-containing alcohol dehydrogenase [Coriobacteriia bacterium]|nr:iron-containing alcohol dehydrogenase [Coriobacteriia bacterium]
MIPAYYEFSNHAKVLSGENAVENIAYELKVLEAAHPIVVTNRQLRDLGLVDIVLRALADGGIDVCAIYDAVPVDSSVDVVNDLAKTFRKTGCDAIIAVGGGSVLDTAKGANIVLTTGSTDIKEFMGSEVITARAMVPFIAVPTTAGTGSEVTGAAVIKDTERHVKMGFVSYLLLPDVAVLDPRMTEGLPPRLTASTGLDALTHAVEAFSCRQANPLSDGYARAAIDLIREYLVKTLEDGQDRTARLAMANAAMLAGVSFSNAMVGIVHAIGHACGGQCSVAHGDAMGILLPYGMEYNMDVAGERYGELLLHLKGAEVYASTPAAERPRVAVEAVRELLGDAARRAGMPMRLSQVGVTEADLPAIAATAINDGAMSLNPKDADISDILGILRAAL